MRRGEGEEEASTPENRRKEGKRRRRREDSQTGPADHWDKVVNMLLRAAAVVQELPRV